MTAIQILQKADAKRMSLARGYTYTIRNFDFSKGEFSFSTTGQEVYEQRIKVNPIDWRLLKKFFLKVKDDEDEAFGVLRSLAKKAGILIYCDCPDFLYGGFAYIAHKLGFGLVRESRPPRKRNKNLKGSACKHLLRILMDLK